MRTPGFYAPPPLVEGGAPNPSVATRLVGAVSIFSAAHPLRGYSALCWAEGSSTAFAAWGARDASRVADSGALRPVGACSLLRALTSTCASSRKASGPLRAEYPRSGCAAKKENDTKHTRPACSAAAKAVLDPSTQQRAEYPRSGCAAGKKEMTPSIRAPTEGLGAPPSPEGGARRAPGSAIAKAQNLKPAAKPGQARTRTSSPL